jgi:hypothetical protein
LSATLPVSFAAANSGPAGVGAGGGSPTDQPRISSGGGRDDLRFDLTMY